MTIMRHPIIYYPVQIFLGMLFFLLFCISLPGLAVFGSIMAVAFSIENVKEHNYLQKRYPPRDRKGNSHHE